MTQGNDIVPVRDAADDTSGREGGRGGKAGRGGVGAAGAGASDILPRLGSFFVSAGFFQLGVDFHEGVVSGTGAAAGGFSSSFGAATGFFQDGVELDDVFQEDVASSLDDSDDVGVDVLFVLEL